MTVSLANQGQVVVGCQGEDILLGDAWRQDISCPSKVVAEPGAVIKLYTAEVELVAGRDGGDRTVADAVEELQQQRVGRNRSAPPGMVLNGTLYREHEFLNLQGPLFFRVGAPRAGKLEVIVEGGHPGEEMAAKLPVHPALGTGGRAPVQLDPPSKGNNLLRLLVRQNGELGL